MVGVVLVGEGGVGEGCLRVLPCEASRAVPEVWGEGVSVS